MNKPTVLITGAAIRLGKATAEAFFERGCNLVLHYNQSHSAAKALKQSFNQRSENSCQILQANLNQPNEAYKIIDFCLHSFGRLDYLINNASVFYPTPIDSASVEQLDTILKTNLVAPVNLSRAAFHMLKDQLGSIVNLIDIYAQSGLNQHSFYVASKAALLASSKQLATDFAPHVRVNAVSPGAILWPESTLQQLTQAQLNQQQSIIENTALKKVGQPQAIAKTITYLAMDASYTTGSLVNVDGGRRLYI